MASVRSTAAAVLALALVALAGSPPPAGAQLPLLGSVITNGVVMLGVMPMADLNVPSAIPSTGNGIGAGTTVVGLRYVPNDTEATADGCPCEGWGASYDGTTSGYVDESCCPSGPGITPISFISTTSTAESVVEIDELRVTHTFLPNALSPNLYEVRVAMQNIGGTSMSDLKYQRTMDWDIEPTAFSEYVTLVAGAVPPPSLESSNDNGFCTPDPLTTCSPLWFTGPPVGSDTFDNGPGDHGANFVFNFGTLPAGATKNFKIYYGASGTEIEALNALTLVGASVYTLGQCSPPGVWLLILTPCDQTTGTPNTFFFGFANIEVIPPPPPPSPPPPPPPPPVAPPIAKFTVSPPPACGPVTITFDDGSIKGKGEIIAWFWDFGDGGSSMDQDPTHTYTESGIYTVTLTVFDDEGLTDMEEMDLKVEVKDCPIPATTPSDGEGLDSRPRDSRDDALAAFDLDGDNVADADDNCPAVANGDQLDTDLDGAGNECDADRDADGIGDGVDNCLLVRNPDQTDLDLDNMGDACDADADGDAVSDLADNCLMLPNKLQADADDDGRGDACDTGEASLDGASGSVSDPERDGSSLSSSVAGIGANGAAWGGALLAVLVLLAVLFAALRRR